LQGCKWVWALMLDGLQKENILTNLLMELSRFL
jgi:hypothetical protein